MEKKTKVCSICKQELDVKDFIEARSKFLVDGYMPFCKDCLVKKFRKNGEEQSFNLANKLCQFIDIPFIPNNWISLYQTNKERTFELYAQLFNKEDYETVDWEEYNKKYLQLRAEHKLQDEFNFLKEEERNQLRLKWGSEYSDEEILYLEQLYTGLLQTQNVNGSLQVDQAKKLCKISLIIDTRIREEGDFDKLLASYDKLVKIAEFTPKNAKNAGDFDSAGEIFAFLEKKGWMNKFYDGAVRDEVDNTMKSIQNWLRNFYINETGIPEDIANRIEGLKIAKELEDQNSLYTDEEMTPEEFDDYEKELFNTDKFEEELS